MGWLERTARVVGSVAREVLKQRTRNHAPQRPSRTQTGQPPRTAGTRTDTRPPHSTASVFAPYASAKQVVPYGGPLPALQYSPETDGNADPGEVVWAWVPYEDDPSQGKDRPILILAVVPGGYVAVQLTSRDRAHTDSYTVDHHGRIWLDVGAGQWDRQGRPSEARLDRLLYAPEHAIRREGSALSQAKYLAVAEALHAIYVTNNGASR